MCRAGDTTKERRQGRRDKPGRPGGRKEKSDHGVERVGAFSPVWEECSMISQADQDVVSGELGECGIMGEVGNSLEAIASRGPSSPGGEQPTRGQVMDRLREFLDVMKEQG